MALDSHRLSFGAVADHYDKVRPAYPIEALDLALGSAPLRVVDLGAGTGLLTRVALAAGHDVVPVEPDGGMRTQLDLATPGVTALAGSAEQIPLPDASVDAVICGQAYHWFQPETAHPEIARVLRPNGVFAALWNDRDVSTEWTVLFDEIITSCARAYEHRADVTDFGPLFAATEVLQVRHFTTQTPQGLCDLIASRSYFLTASAQQQADLVTQVRELCANHPDLVGRSSFELPYTTTIHKTRRLA